MDPDFTSPSGVPLFLAGASVAVSGGARSCCPFGLVCSLVHTSTVLLDFRGKIICPGYKRARKGKLDAIVGRTRLRREAFCITALKQLYMAKKDV